MLEVVIKTTRLALQHDHATEISREQIAELSDSIQKLMATRKNNVAASSFVSHVNRFVADPIDSNFAALRNELSQLSGVKFAFDEPTVDVLRRTQLMLTEQAVEKMKSFQVPAVGESFDEPRAQLEDLLDR